MLKKNKLIIKKPIFVKGLDPLNPNKFAYVIKWENYEMEQSDPLPEELSFKISKLIPENILMGNRDIN